MYHLRVSRTGTSLRCIWQQVEKDSRHVNLIALWCDFIFAAFVSDKMDIEFDERKSVCEQTRAAQESMPGEDKVLRKNTAGGLFKRR